MSKPTKTKTIKKIMHNVEIKPIKKTPKPTPEQKNAIRINGIFDHISNIAKTLTESDIQKNREMSFTVRKDDPQTNKQILFYRLVCNSARTTYLKNVTRNTKILFSEYNPEIKSPKEIQIAHVSYVCKYCNNWILESIHPDTNTKTHQPNFTTNKL